MARRIRDSVIVVTGASSGIGRATAVLAARRGAAVVLVGRSERALDDAAEECRRGGGRALVVPVDVTAPDAMERVARDAVETFGRIDVWINNAGVYALGRFEDIPPESFRRVIETNLLAYVDGARAALRVFHGQGEGTLINNASVVGIVAEPSASPYVASKYAVRGFSEALRQELRRQRGIEVCTVMPSVIDTPIFQHAANYTGRALRAMPPAYRSERVARAMLRLVRRPRAEVVVGATGRALAATSRVAPRTASRAMAAFVERLHFKEQAAPRTDGNLFTPLPQQADIHGGWRNPAARRAAIAAGAAAAAAVAARAKRSA